MSKPFYLERGVAFYITNVCNLTCSECQSFSNYSFKGLYEFNYDLYSQWSEKLAFGKGGFAIVGGEPTLHPRLKEWMIGLRKLWPDSPAEIATNGTYLHKCKDLHKLCADYNYKLDIAVHAKHFRHDLAKNIIKAVGGNCRIEKFHDDGLSLRTNLGVHLRIKNYEYHHKSMIKNSETFEFHDNNPVEAYNKCPVKNCYHMVDGKIYKCGPLARIEDFLEQHKKEVPKLIKEYTPVTLDNISNDLLKMSLTGGVIKQCSLCSVQNENVYYVAQLKNSYQLKTRSKEAS